MKPEVTCNPGRGLHRRACGGRLCHDSGGGLRAGRLQLSR
jgi:hypothetical protein